MIGTNGISIHTTRKVVTDIDWDKAHKKIISIHTTRKVVTGSFVFFLSVSYYFNPHHPQGGDMEIQ